MLETRIFKILNSGYATVIGAILAIFVGLYFPEIGKSLTPFGNIFLTFISISVIPIIFSSVTCSVIRMLSNKLSEITASKIIFTFAGVLFLAALVGLLTGIFINPGEKIMKSEFIANMIFQDVQNSVQELSIFEPFSSMQKFSFTDFISTLLPKNPFAAFAEGNIIQILSVSILVGFAIAHLEREKREITLRSLTVLMQSFKKILKIPMKILPIGMFLLLASGMAKIELEDLLAMKQFIFSTIFAFTALIFIAFILFARYSPVGFLKSIKAIKEAVVVAF